MSRGRTIDAVSMVRRIREQHAEQLKDARPEERIAFYREQSERLHESFGLSGPEAQPPIPPAAR